MPEELESAVPIIDLGPLRNSAATSEAAAATVEAIGRACEEIGFLVIEGHGVPDGTVARAEQAAREFFALPAEAKAQCMPSETWHFRGYEMLGGSALARSLGDSTPPDLCELFRISRFDDPAASAGYEAVEPFDYFFGPNIWPDQPPELRPALSEYYREVEQLATTLMEAFARALGLTSDYFAPFIDRHISNLCVNYYPAQAVPPEPGQLRRGAHSDYGSMTILYQSDSPGGLQVMTKSGAWADVPYRPGSFVVNLGDMLARWTNDRWVSTMHRVVNPEPDLAMSDRVSIPFFHQPNVDAVVECLPGCSSEDDPPRHPATTSGHWVLGKTRKQVGAD